MPIPPEQQKSFEEAAKPLIQWLNENWHPHACVFVTCTSAEVLEGQAIFNTDEFFKD